MRSDQPPVVERLPLRASGVPFARVCVYLTRVRFNTASCIATSTSWPRPVFWRCTRAARIAIVRCMPVPESPIFAPLTIGGAADLTGNAHCTRGRLRDRLEAFVAAVGAVGPE